MEYFIKDVVTGLALDPARVLAYTRALREHPNKFEKVFLIVGEDGVVYAPAVGQFATERLVALEEVHGGNTRLSALESGGRVRVVPETEIAQYIADVRSRWFDLGDHEKDRMLAAIDALVSLDEIRDACRATAVNCSEGKEHEDENA